MVKLTFKQFRVLFLLSILVYVITDQAIAQYYARSWKSTLHVVIYPINGDATQASQQIINTLTEKKFAALEQFIAQQAQQYGVQLHLPIKIKLAAQVEKPPALPKIDAGMFSAMLWSLKMRWWAWYENSYSGAKDIRLFIEYYANETPDSQISVGLEKGMIALIKNYANKDLMQRNNVIIAHEMLHTLGATDKYNPSTLQPYYPQGYANPLLKKGQKQQKCEIMGGRIPYSIDFAVVPDSLNDCLIGTTTAKEIGWI